MAREGSERAIAIAMGYLAPLVSSSLLTLSKETPDNLPALNISGDGIRLSATTDAFEFTTTDHHVRPCFMDIGPRRTVNHVLHTRNNPAIEVEFTIRIWIAVPSGDAEQYVQRAAARAEQALRDAWDADHKFGANLDRAEIRQTVIDGVERGGTYWWLVTAPIYMKYHTIHLSTES